MGARNFLPERRPEDTEVKGTSDRWRDLSQVEIKGVLVMDMIAHNRDNGRDIFQISPGKTGDSLRLAHQAVRPARYGMRTSPDGMSLLTGKDASPDSGLRMCISLLPKPYT